MAELPRRKREPPDWISELRTDWERTAVSLSPSSSLSTPSTLFVESANPTSEAAHSSSFSFTLNRCNSSSLECKSASDASKPHCFQLPHLQTQNAEQQSDEQLQEHPEDPSVQYVKIDFPPLQGDIVYGTQRLKKIRSPDYYEAMLRIKSHAFYRCVRQVISMNKPVLAMAILVTVYVRLIVVQAQQQNKLIFRDALPYVQQPSDSLSQKMVGALLNGSLVVAGALAVTLLFIVIYRFELRQGLLRLLQFIVLILLGGPWGYFL